HGAADRHLGVVGVPERPAVARALAGVGEVVAVGRGLDREGPFLDDLALLPIELPEDAGAAVFLLELAERGVFGGAERGRILVRLEDVLGVRGDETAAVLADEERVLDDLLGREVAEVDDANSAVDLLVDEAELPVVLTIRLAQRDVVGIAVVDLLAVDVALGEDGLGLFAETVALPWFRGEDGDRLVDAHRRDTDDVDLAGMAAGREHQELVHLARRHVGLERRGHVFRGQLALGDDAVDFVAEILSGRRRLRTESADHGRGSRDSGGGADAANQLATVDTTGAQNANVVVHEVTPRALIRRRHVTAIALASMVGMASLDLTRLKGGLF